MAFSTPQQRVVHYEGHVQGVGFRQTTLMVAQRFEISGYVQNLPDGRVKLVMVGTSDEMDRVEEAIHQRLGEFVRDRTVENLPATDQYTDFNVRY